MRTFRTCLGAALLAALLPATAPAQEGVKPDNSQICRGKFKSASQIASAGFHWLKDENVRRNLSEELAADMACEAAAGRAKDPCKAAMDTVAKAAGGSDKKLAGNMNMRCQHAYKFSAMYHEALTTKPTQERYPACQAYFAHAVPILDAKKALFDKDICGVIAANLRDKKDDFCSSKPDAQGQPAIDKYVLDQKMWPTMCKAAGKLWLNADSSVCSFWSDPERCAAEVALTRAFLNPKSPEGCPQGVMEGGVCRALLPGAKGKKACEPLFQRLQGDFCGQLATVMTNNEPEDK